MQPNKPNPPTDNNQPESYSPLPGSSITPTTPPVQPLPPVSAPEQRSEAAPGTLPVTPGQVHQPSPAAAAPPTYTPPSANVTPVTAFSAGGAFSSTQSAPPSTKGSKRPLLIVVGAVLALVAVGLIGYWMLLKPAGPDAVFKQSLENAFSTKNLTQQAAFSGTDQSYVQKFDVQNPKKPRVSVVMKYGDSASSEGYGTSTNSYVKYDKQASNSSLSIDASLLDKWIQVKNNNEQPKDFTPLLAPFGYSDPDFSTLGQYVFANFDKQTRQELVKYVRDEQVYEYDASKVKPTKLDGQEVYVYQVKIFAKKLAAYNRKVAAKMDIPSSAVKTLSNLYQDETVTMYVTTKSKQLVQVKTTAGDIIKYGAWNTTTLPAEPKADMQYEEYVANILGSLGSEDIQTGNVQQRAQDTERKTDINAVTAHLEAFYATTGRYPLLSEINDKDWRSENMQGLDEAALVDPVGNKAILVGSPAANSYSYQVGTSVALGACQGDDCQYYVLTATLHDGTTYDHKSLNE